MNKSKKKYYKRKTSKNKIHNGSNQRGGRAVQGYPDTGSWYSKASRT